LEIKKPQIKFNKDSCSLCPFFKQTSSPFNSLWGKYENTIDYIFVFERNHTGKNVGDNSEIFLNVLEEHFEKNNIGYLVIPASLCYAFDKNKTKQATESCRDNIDLILSDIKSVNKMFEKDPPKIILLGKTLVDRFFENKEIRKSTLSDLRNRKLLSDVYPDFEFFFTFSPLSFIYSQENIDPFVLDLKDIIAGDKKIEEEKIDENYFLIDSMDLLNQVKDILMESESIAFDIETSGLNYYEFIKIKERKVKGQVVSEESYVQDRIIGISFSNEIKSGVYIPLWIRGNVFKQYYNQYELENPHWTIEEIYLFEDDDYYFFLGKNNEEIVIKTLKDILENPKSKKIAHNGKFDMGFLKASLDIWVENFHIDTMLAAHILDENLPKSLEYLTDSRYMDLRGYKSIVYNQLRKEDKENETYDRLPLDLVWIYGAKDTDATFRLSIDLLKEIDEKTELSKTQRKGSFDGRRVLFDFYMPLSIAYTRCELKGIYYDSDYAYNLALEYTEDMKLLQSEIDEVAKMVSDNIPYETKKDGVYISLSSPLQMKKFLFEDLNWPRFQETAKAKDARKYRNNDRASGYIIEAEDASTDANTMKKLLEYFDKLQYTEESDLILKILNWKKKQKMISTYLLGKKLRQRLDRNNFVHYSMKITGTTSGRLSCLDGETELIINNDKVLIKDICPMTIGELDTKHINNFNIKTHKSRQKQIEKTVNKGLGEMVEITFSNGKIKRCTKDHELMTPLGFKSVRYIIENDLEVII